MALVKRPGSVEAHLEPFQPSPAGEAEHVIDLHPLEGTTMAPIKAPETGSYRVGNAWIKVQQGDPLPEGAKPVKRAGVKKQQAPENRQAPEPENRQQSESENK